MRILLLAHSFNSLTQRLFVELTEAGHDVSVEFDINDAVTREAVALFAPDIVLASFLRRAIPPDVWQARPCLIVHPGIPGDRGPSALDWAILRDEPDWGVTVLQAEAELDGGPVWAEARFPMRAATKSSLYRHEVTEAAVVAVFAALARIARGAGPLGRADASARACARSLCRQADRAIDWAADTTEDVLRKLRSADGSPGVRDTLFGAAVHLFDAHPARGLGGEPGAVIARAGGALGRATRDGAVWIGQVRRPGPHALKRPAAEEFAAAAASLPEIAGAECQPIRYREDGDVGFLSFAFHAGAMGVAECASLRAAYAQARTRPTRVLVLLGGPDHWSNGLHLGTIEAADSPADESWRNINAMNDLARDIITTTEKLVVAVLRGGAGAGGVFLALAADEVWAARGAILNPHYKDMGNL
ncbi:MAG TPA: hydrogenase maturation protein, partial [Acetobacteraceae bacterium]|nr:hydrogenase maturation protein [Acetobacteraceae bacterium]